MYNYQISRDNLVHYRWGMWITYMYFGVVILKSRFLLRVMLVMIPFGTRQSWRIYLSS